MAVYEWKCEECGEKGEENRKVEDRDDVYICKGCGSIADRLVSSSSFQLKGTCWSKDNYTRHLGDHPDWKNNKWRNTNES